VKDMGKVMAVLKERYAGQMDFAKASGTVKGMLSGAWWRCYACALGWRERPFE